MLHSTFNAVFALPRTRRARSLRLCENLFRFAANASSTKPFLPISSLSVKYHTRQRSIYVIPNSSTII